LESQHLYSQKAIEVCQYVFEQEYFNGLGIPLPEIKFIEPDSHNYSTGEYYIRVGETWQIHLNFGSLPKNILDFAEEVKVLTRHEIEHYKTCPFDVITHFRMLNTIVQAYEKQYSQLNIDIKSLAPHLANQISDVIIDTHNFRRYPKETLKSEIAWIKKGSSLPFNELPGHSKLMFLAKAALWGNDLELNETDEDLLSKVRELAGIIDERGITSPDGFLEKAKQYCSLFFDLYKNSSQNENNKSESKSSSQPSSQASPGQQNAQPQMLPSKDSQPDGSGSAFIFSTPDKIESAIEQFAQETDLKHFQQILDSAGIKNLSDTDKKRIWFEAQNIDEIAIPTQIPKGSNDNYTYPDLWKIGDPIEDLDLMLTFSISPKLIPGITTKKWSKNNVYYQSVEKVTTDLLLILDSSGSMGKLENTNSKLYNAVLSSFAIIRHFEKMNADVALINFATTAKVTKWTKDYKSIKNGLLFDGHGNTIFPLQELENLRSAKKQNIAIVIITDGEIQNHLNLSERLKEHLRLGNKLFMFLQDQKGMTEQFKELSDYGATISQAFTADEIRNIVLEDLSS
jgi:hypothetical protein